MRRNLLGKTHYTKILSPEGQGATVPRLKRPMLRRVPRERKKSALRSGGPGGDQNPHAFRVDGDLDRAMKAPGLAVDGGEETAAQLPVQRLDAHAAGRFDDDLRV